MFEKDRFIEDCRVALKEGDVPAAIREVVQRAVRDPAGIVTALGEPTARASRRSIGQAISRSLSCAGARGWNSTRMITACGP